ncbi:MAG: hypothetical protein AAF253_13240 [Pseudomonadota bacterium]
MTGTHPSDTSPFAALWDTLFGMINTLAALMAPAGNGDIGVSIEVRQRARIALRAAESQLRRLLHAEAETLLPQLAPYSGQDRCENRSKPLHKRRAVQARPWQRFRLHETAETSSGSRPYRHKPRERLDDAFGTLRVSLKPEFERLSCLVVTASNPAHATLRVARILRRRRARGQSDGLWREPARPDTPRPSPASDRPSPGTSPPSRPAPPGQVRTWPMAVP